MGFNISRYLFEDILYRISISPAIGMSILSIFAYCFSIVHVDLNVLEYVVIFLITVTFDIGDFRLITSQKKSEYIPLVKLLLTVFLVVGVRALVFKMPTDNVDNYFHATKIQYILEYMTLFPPKVPVFNVFTYPAGYHVLVSLVVLVSGDLIPHAMLVVRLWSWAFIVLGTYLFASVWFDRKIRLYASMLILVTNICTYYLLVYINPNFIGLYFFMVLLALAYLDIENAGNSKALTIFTVLIGVGALSVPPYGFQNWVFVLSVYLLLKIISREMSIKKALSVGVMYFVTPVVLYVLLNPYFLWPQLASDVTIEYPWASYVGVVVGNLAIFKGKNPMDTWWKFMYIIRWATIRNSNYLATIFLFLGPIAAMRKKLKRKETLSLLAFTVFVILLMLNRLTYNVPVPFLEPLPWRECSSG
ncbi:DUF6541 family protein [Thermococcus cleftensis]|uniref:DUF6541 family protein n=1 Tax=Thermococcus cleftensis (strain DSM 27260 / KACC 17922 / CL1) TaxID=163003 RepID=UPI00065002FD|nr:DUF6541 family protein [Thermococcus cleftensis]